MTDRWCVRTTFAAGAVVAVFFSVVGHFASLRGLWAAMSIAGVLAVPAAVAAAAVGGYATSILKRRGVVVAMLVGVAVAIATVVMVPILGGIVVVFWETDALGGGFMGALFAVLALGTEAMAFGAVSGVVARGLIREAQPTVPADGDALRAPRR